MKNEFGDVSHAPFRLNTVSKKMLASARSDAIGADQICSPFAKNESTFGLAVQVPLPRLI